MAGVMINGTPDSKTGATQFVKVKDTPKDLELTDRVSPVFEVPNDGSGVLITAFGLCTNLFLEQVKVRIDEMPQGGPDCCSCKVDAISTVPENNITNSENVKQPAACNETSGMGITPRSSQAVLAVPGYYRFCATSDRIGSLSLCARLLTPEAMANIPPALVFGNST